MRPSTDHILSLAVNVPVSPATSQTLRGPRMCLWHLGCSGGPAKAHRSRVPTHGGRREHFPLCWPATAKSGFPFFPGHLGGPFTSTVTATSSCWSPVTSSQDTARSWAPASLRILATTVTAVLSAHRLTSPLQTWQLPGASWPLSTACLGAQDTGPGLLRPGFYFRLCLELAM